MKSIAIVMSVIVIGLMCAGVSAAATMVWTAPEGTVDGYRIYQQSLETPVDAVGAEVTEYDLGELVEGEQYTVGVSAFNAAGESEKAAVTFVYERPLPAPAKPGLLLIRWITGD